MGAEQWKYREGAVKAVQSAAEQEIVAANATQRTARQQEAVAKSLKQQLDLEVNRAVDMKGKAGKATPAAKEAIAAVADTLIAKSKVTKEQVTKIEAAIPKPGALSAKGKETMSAAMALEGKLLHETATHRACVDM